MNIAVEDHPVGQIDDAQVGVDPPLAADPDRGLRLALHELLLDLDVSGRWRGL